MSIDSNGFWLNHSERVRKYYSYDKLIVQTDNYFNNQHVKSTNYNSIKTLIHVMQTSLIHPNNKSA